MKRQNIHQNCFPDSNQAGNEEEQDADVQSHAIRRSAAVDKCCPFDSFNQLRKS
jgi:hypothetical protein